MTNASHAKRWPSAPSANDIVNPKVHAALNLACRVLDARRRVPFSSAARLLGDDSFGVAEDTPTNVWVYPPAASHPRVQAHLVGMGTRGRKGSIEAMTRPLRVVAPPRPVELPAPPEHLSATMQAWWREAVAEYDFDAHHLLLLEAAAD